MIIEKQNLLNLNLLNYILVNLYLAIIDILHDSENEQSYIGNIIRNHLVIIQAVCSEESGHEQRKRKYSVGYSDGRFGKLQPTRDGISLEARSFESEMALLLPLFASIGRMASSVSIMKSIFIF